MHNDKILCDVVPKITFTHEKNKYIFYPLTSPWMLDGQIRLKLKIKTEK